jgi:hypothetical protein
MVDASRAIDAYLVARFGIGLERVLSDATAGVVSLAIAGSVKIACDPVGTFAYEDGGASEQYQGVLTVEGVTYRFRCSVFTDAGDARFVESIGELEAVQWGVRVATSPDAKAGRLPPGLPSRENLANRFNKASR